ncbi:MAG: cation diffusion facilitator family transporter [Spirochaetota bacterium]
MAERVATIKLASWIGITGNAFLALLKIIAGLISGSLAVVADGIDSATDVLGSVVTLFTAVIINQPPDREHPFGHSRAETLATAVLAFIIFFAGAQLMLTTVRSFIGGETPTVPSILGVYVIIISIVGKMLLALSQYYLGKKASSPMIIANAKNMQNDILISAGVLAGLGFTIYFKLPIIDPIIATIISVMIMKTAVQVYMDTNRELMGGGISPAIYSHVNDAVRNTVGATNPHRMRVRKMGEYYFIDIDIEVAEHLSVKDAHQIAVAVEEEIKQRIPNVYDIMVHIEPEGNLEEMEKFGLCPDDVDKL